MGSTRKSGSTRLLWSTAAVVAALQSGPSYGWRPTTDDELQQRVGGVTGPCGKQCGGPSCFEDVPCNPVTVGDQTFCQAVVAIKIGHCVDCYLWSTGNPPECLCPVCTETERAAEMLYKGNAQRDENGEWHCPEGCTSYDGYGRRCTGCYYGGSA